MFLDAQNLHIRMSSEGSCDWCDITGINYILRHIQLENICFQL